MANISKCLGCVTNGLTLRFLGVFDITNFRQTLVVCYHGRTTG